MLFLVLGGTLHLTSHAAILNPLWEPLGFPPLEIVSDFDFDFDYTKGACIFPGHKTGDTGFGKRRETIPGGPEKEPAQGLF